LKKLLFLLLVVLAACNQPVKQLSRGPADWIYVSTTGNDLTGDGTSAAPYATIATGISHASAGDTVFIVAGTYNVSTQIVLPVGVSLMGEGDVSDIHFTYQCPSFDNGINTAAITLSSVVENTPGNQSISYLKLDGDMTSTNPILVKRRGNVKIHHCTIVDFAWIGVYFDNAPNLITPPTIRAAGNEIYDCTIDNCANTAGTWTGGALIGFIGQDGILIHDNLLYQNSRAEGLNGSICTSYGRGYSRRMKYYNNKSYKPDYDGTAWNFHLELMNGWGGDEIYNNEFYDGDVPIDIAGSIGHFKGDDDYACRIYDNYFTGTPVQTYHGKYSIDIECFLSEDFYIYNNHFYNIPAPLHLSAGTYPNGNTRRIYFYYNLLSMLGWNDPTKYNTCIDLYAPGTATLNDVYIFNNVIEGDGVTHTALKINNNNIMNNIQIINNIILNHTNGAWLLLENTGTLDSLRIENNLMYNNSYSNLIRINAGTTGTNYVNQNNILGSNPLFKSNETFRLRPTSPAIDAGIDVGLTTDYWGHRVPQNGTPDIGACEYGNYVLFYNGKQLY